MTFFLKFDISFFSILMLLLLLLVLHIRKETQSMSTRLFKRIVWVNILMLNLEILSWRFDGQVGRLNYFFNYTFNMLLVWLTPLITTAWASYLDYKMF
jgi:hypothetical protein